MSKKVLIMGLPGSGKTTLAKPFAELIGGVWLNADQVRAQYNDWDFSPEGRIRQAMRMKFLADGVIRAGKIAVADFVCPTELAREEFAADYIVWMDTIQKGRFEDTNQLFEQPTKYDFCVNEWHDDTAEKLAAVFLENPRFASKTPSSLLLGRWQPWHPGHTALFKKALLETGQVVIMVRDVGGIVGSDAGAGRTGNQTDNPFEFETVKNNIIQALSAEGFEYEREYTVMLVPNIVDISYGRGVGYTFTQHDLGEEIHNISATQIRAQLRAEGKLK